MPLTPCDECQESVSDKAIACPKCGCPRHATQENGSWGGAWQAVGKTKTPINVFALAMMACASVFGVSSIQITQESLPAFTYSLHTFIAIAGMFFVILLFCRKAVYHPDDLAKAKAHGVELGDDNPFLAAGLIALLMLGYSAYQGYQGMKQLDKSTTDQNAEIYRAGFRDNM